MTGGPSAGPASAYAMLRRPALICFSGPNDAFTPGLMRGSLADCALAGAGMPSWVAAAVTAATPIRWRRCKSIFSELVFMAVTIDWMSWEGRLRWTPAAGARDARQPQVTVSEHVVFDVDVAVCRLRIRADLRGGIDQVLRDAPFDPRDR